MADKRESQRGAQPRGASKTAGSDGAFGSQPLKVAVTGGGNENKGAKPTGANVPPTPPAGESGVSKSGDGKR